LVIGRRAAIINAMATRDTKYVHTLERRVQAQEDMAVTNYRKKIFILSVCMNKPEVCDFICCQLQIVLGCSFKVNGER
jgi:hypothetical protein